MFDWPRSDGLNSLAGNVIARRNLLAVVLLAPLLGGCSIWPFSSDDDADPSPTPPARPAMTTAPTTTAAPTKTPTPRPTPTPTATPTLTPEEKAQGYLDDVAEQWSETDTVHFVLDVTGPAYLSESPRVELESAEGDLKRPGSVRADASLLVEMFEAQASLIIIEDDAYMTNFFTGEWERAPENLDFNPTMLFSEDEGVGAILSSLDQPELVGAEQIDGREARHIRGTVAGDQVEGVLGGAIDGDRIAVDVWLDAENDELLRAKFDETEGPEDEQVTWDFRFTNHNDDVEIEPPDL